MEWHTPPENTGQIVIVSYAYLGEQEFIRIEDLSEPMGSPHRVSIHEEPKGEIGRKLTPKEFEYEIQNGI